MEELQKVAKELKGSATLQVEQHYELTSTPELLTLAAYVSKYGLVTGKRGPLDLQTLYAPVQGNARTKKSRSDLGSHPNKSGLCQVESSSLLEQVAT